MTTGEFGIFLIVAVYGLLNYYVSRDTDKILKELKEQFHVDN